MNGQESAPVRRKGGRLVVIAVIAVIILLFVFFLKDIMIPLIRLEMRHDLHGVRELLDASGLERRQIAGVGVGIPIYGESDQADRTIEEICRAAFSGLRYSVVHDGVVGHLGALSGRPGVNVVAGTGSIALGMDAEGHTVRCGGWGHYFSDEGSCYWMGLQAMALFCRQADGRLPKGPLYAIIREKYGLKSDYEFVPLMGRDVMPVRSRVAVQQRLLLEAADAGDGAAVAVYALVKSFPEDYDAEGKLIVEGAKMANDTFKGVGYAAGIFSGWLLERRLVGFSTEASLPVKLTRGVTGLLGYYIVSLICVPLIKKIPGPAGTLISCFLQTFWILFLFPLCVKFFEKKMPAGKTQAESVRV